MPGLNDLKPTKLKDDVPSFDALPEERGSFTPPPQPGSYRFKLPAVINNFDVFDAGEFGERMVHKFEDEHPLLIVQSPGKKHDGEAFSTRLDNRPRPRGKEKVLVSDLDYLLRAKGVTKKPDSNKAYGQALQALAGQEFGADVEWSWGCNKRRAARFVFDDGSVQRLEDPESTLDGDDAGFKAGCGKYTYQGDVQKVEGEYPLVIDCPECNARVRAFANLRNFKA